MSKTGVYLLIVSILFFIRVTAYLHYRQTRYKIIKDCTPGQEDDLRIFYRARSLASRQT
jgi:hypothetical protein